MSDMNTLFKQLEPLSLFELSRLRTAISRTLADPMRNEAIKRQLKIGMQITYFSSKQNDLVEATVVDIRKTRATVVNTVDGSSWYVKFYAINLQGINTDILPKKPLAGLDRNSLKVGDRVGFLKAEEEVYGIVTKLNPKRALIQLSNGDEWFVSYPLLFLVIDGLSTQIELPWIEGEVIQ